MSRTVLYGTEDAKKYRQSDEEEVASANHAYICGRLGEITRSFDRMISALDLGCGTGRYFHCLKQVASLTGVDLSAEMLEQARTPVKVEEIKIHRIQTVCGDILEVSFSPASFEVIYSLGVLGEHCPLEPEMCNRLYDWLKTGGKLFFSVVDIASKPGAKSLKRRVAEAVLKLCPRGLASKIARKFSTHYLTERQLREIMRQSKFNHFQITHHVSKSPKWTGAHFLCLSSKDL